MDSQQSTVSWMIGGGLRQDPAEVRNRAHLRALRVASARPSVTDRVRAFLTASTPTMATPVDRACCPA